MFRAAVCVVAFLMTGIAADGAHAQDRATASPEISAPLEPAAPIAPSHLQAARDLVSALHTESVMDEMLGLMLPLIRQSGVGRSYGADPERVAELFQQEFRLRFSAMNQDMAIIYARRFSETDLIAIAAFLRTPVGAAWIGSQAAMVQEGSVIGQRYGEEAGRAVTARLELERKTLNP